MEVTDLRKRCSADPVSTRLGNLASNLARFESLAGYGGQGAAVRRLLEESEFFVEWTACDIEPERGGDLVELQIRLARWILWPDDLWNDPVRRRDLADQARAWSDRVLEMSGLLRA